jgi:hypothetical protein
MTRPSDTDTTNQKISHTSLRLLRAGQFRRDEFETKAPLYGVHLHSSFPLHEETVFFSPPCLADHLGLADSLVVFVRRDGLGKHQGVPSRCDGWYVVRPLLQVALPCLTSEFAGAGVQAIGMRMSVASS